MRIVASTLDDLCRRVYKSLLHGAEAISPTRNAAHERIGALLELTNPRARLSRTETRGKPFSCLGELLWYLSRDNRVDFISNYISRYEDESEDGETIYGGYGPRLFNMRGNDQIRAISDMLRTTPTTRRAVIQIFDAEDTSRRRKEVPCTCTLQFLLRRNRLSLLVNMRSNDAYMGLPHDTFCFTMLQELVARAVGAELGHYKLFVGSLHLYDKDRDSAEQYLSEGIQRTIEMPPMPHGAPWPSVSLLLEAEAQIRSGQQPSPAVFKIDPYWSDLVRMLQIFAATGDARKIQRLKNAMAFSGYHVYVEGRKHMKPRTVQLPRQLLLPMQKR